MSLELVKSMLTTLVAVLALVQVLGMAQVRGYVHLVPTETRQLVLLHRWGGITALALILLVAGLCLFSVFGLGYALSSPRLQLHAAMGALAALLLFLKVLITNRFRRYLRFNPALGALAGLLIMGIFLSSALWYFVQGG